MSEVSNIRPVEYKILIEVDQTETVTAGGIILPETTREKQQIAQEQGRIIAMGEKACSEPEIWGSRPPKVGDKVIFSKYAGATLQKLGKKYRLIQDKDLGAVIEE
jgi:chaperonin GroES